MAYTKPPARKRLDYKSRLQGMAPQTDIFLPGALPGSIKTIASRLNGKHKPRYQTAKEATGTRVWRIK